jgi:hypothetical protein
MFVYSGNFRPSLLFIFLVLKAFKKIIILFYFILLL